MSAADNTGPAVPEDSIMSLRDYFAAHAPAMPHALREIANLAARADGRDTCDYGAVARLEADWRWCYADAMLKARAS